MQRPHTGYKAPAHKGHSQPTLLISRASPPVLLMSKGMRSSRHARLWDLVLVRMARRQASGCEVNHSGAGDRDSTDSLKSGLQHCSRSSGILDTIPFPRLQDAGTVQGPWRGLQSVPVECLSQLPQPGWPPASLSASGSRVLLYPPTCPSMACSALPRGGSEQDQVG